MPNESTRQVMSSIREAVVSEELAASYERTCLAQLADGQLAAASSSYMNVESFRREAFQARKRAASLHAAAIHAGEDMSEVKWR